jgi:hypothetical protein
MSMWQAVPHPNPNPGSAHSREMGCRCPTDENNRGTSAPFPPDGWWLDPACVIHGTRLILAKVNQA